MFVIIIVVFIIYLICISTRRCKNVSKSLEPNMYAHRGLHDNVNFPFENSLEAFRLAVEHGYGIELDVQFTSDNKIVVAHDNDLNRLCGVDRKISECSWEELQEYKLMDGSNIPLFSDVLKLVDGKVPLMVEIKSYNDVYKLSKNTYEMLSSYNGDYCIESFNPFALLWFRKNAPHVFRGQLAGGTIGIKLGVEFFNRLLLKLLLVNLISAPHFISYTSEHDSNLSMFLLKKIFRPKFAAFTLRNQEEFDRAINKGYTMPIFEGFLPSIKK